MPARVWSFNVNQTGLRQGLVPAPYPSLGTPSSNPEGIPYPSLGLRSYPGLETDKRPEP